MSDDQHNDNLPGEEPNMQGGWHKPREVSLWHAPDDTNDASSSELRNAFPDDVTDRPQEQGSWHLPSPDDTTLTADMQIAKGQTVEIEPQEQEESPEDMIQRLLGERPTQTTPETSSVAPEDYVIPSQAQAIDNAPVAPEDFEIPIPEPDVDDIETPNNPDADTSNLLPVDDDLPPNMGLYSGTGPLEARADTSRDVAQTLDKSANDRIRSTPKPIPPLDLNTREYAEKFRAVQNQYAVAREIYNNREISYEEYQNALYDNMVQDEHENWWVINPETGKWNRHDGATEEWVEDYPAALYALDQYEQAVQEQATSGHEHAPTSAPTAYDLPAIDATQQPARAGEPIYDSQGVKIGEVPTTNDLEHTMPSSDPLATSLHAVDEQAIDTTMRSPSMQGETIPAARSSQYAEDNTDNSAELDSAFSAIRGERRNRTTRIILQMLLGSAVIGLIGFIALSVIVVIWYNNTVTPYREAIAALADYDPPFQTARIYDANGALIVELNSSENGARTAIPLENMSPYIVHAIISQENERFYTDPGFDPIAIVRAFIQNLSGSSIQSGASTITQQIAKNLVLQDSEVTAERKINEVLVALEIANNYDKDFILELYLNEVFFGNQSYGIEAASQFYFGHSASELNYAESALLASIVPSPASNDPVVNRPTALSNMRATMSKMLDIGCLQFQHGDWPARGPFCINENSTVQYEGEAVPLLRLNSNDEINGGLVTVQIAEIETMEFQPRNVRLKYPHFVNYIQAEIEAEFGTNALFQRGFNIYTTLIPSVQETAQDTLTQQVARLVDTGVNTGSVMVTDPNTGAIRAMVGSHDFTDDVAGQVNNALTYQQPGSSIKPIVYTASLIGNQGNYLTPASILWDVPVTYDIGGGQTYRPTNFDNRYYGPVPLRYALQNSYNIPAVKAYVEVGNQQFSEVAQAMGLQFAEGSQLGLASALGANEVRLIDMMQAYGVLANGGLRTDLYAIERVTETGEGGEELEVVRNPRPEPMQVISPQVAYLMQNILSDDNARAQQFGTGSNLTLARLGLPTQNHIAAKTGTSNDSRDLWTMGFSRNVVVGVWLGTYDNSPTYGTTGYNSASPVWNTIFEAALRGRTPPEFQNPGGVIAQEVCRTTGTLSYDGCPERTTDLFVRDQYPPPPDDGFVQTIAIDSWTGLRANQFCDDYIVEETFADINDPSAVDWLNTSPEGQAYARQVGLPIPLQTVPLNECAQGQTLPSVSVSYPNANQVIQGQVSIRGLVQAPDFSRYELAYASVTQPDTFYPVVVSQNQVISNGSELGTWDTTQVANGVYIIRLVAISTANGQIVVDIPVTVQNTLPTPTPAIPTVAPNPTLLPSGGTPIPFENESFDGGFEALPAPTFTPLGG